MMLFITIIYIVLFLTGLYFLFPKLGLPAYRGLIPFLNMMDLAEKVGRSRWYGLLSLIPIVHFFIIASVTVALLRSFGRNSLWEHAIGAFLAPISFWMLAFDKNASFQEPIVAKEKAYEEKIKEAEKAGRKAEAQRLTTQNPYKKPFAREWLESIVFAVFAASFIRMFLIEAYVIPTPSMEGSLLVGDFLFVSKMSYGIRTPQTVASIPLLHNRIPGLGIESYSKNPSLPYGRIPGFGDVERNDPFVFNWPVGDSVYITSQRSYTYSQAEFLSENGTLDRELIEKHNEKDYLVRPDDKKDFYIKRCIGLPGDTLRIINRVVHIDGQPAPQPEELQFSYIINYAGDRMPIEPFRKIGLSNHDLRQDPSSGQVIATLSDEEKNKLAQIDSKIKITPKPQTNRPQELFPHDPDHFDKWTVDNYGPIWIPKKGTTVTLTPENIALYKRIISVYEGNTLAQQGEQFVINGKTTNEYTFQQNYYWAMGDNRHNSEDSRMWGFVPFDHIVGKPLIIWMSAKEGSLANGIRWNRIFKRPSN